MKFFMILVCLLLLASPTLAGDPGDDFWALVAIRKVNWEIDDKASAAAAALSAGKVNLSAAAARWRDLRATATRLKAQSLAAESGGQAKAAKELTKMMRLQILRLESLLKAADLEAKLGMSAAKPFWAAQLRALQAYKEQEAVVLDLMNWIEENP